MLQIGEFSRLSRISVRMLRHYDQVGLLKPVEQDAQTGYRRYAVSQLAEANRITVLRDLGFPIREIGRLAHADDRELARALDDRARELEEGIGREQRRLADLLRFRQDVEAGGAAISCEVTLVSIPSYQVVALRMELAGYGEERRAWERLGAFMSDIDQHSPFRVEITPTVREMFSRMAPNMGFPMKLIFANLWLFGPLVKKLMPAISPAGAAMMQTTCAFTTAKGAEGLNVLPSEAYVTANLRFIHHQPNEESIALLRKRAAKYNLETEILYQDYPCKPVDYQAAPFKLLEKVAGEIYPGYGFAQNVGYGTKQHLEGLETLGVTPIHRRTFEPIKSMLKEKN